MNESPYGKNPAGLSLEPAPVVCPKCQYRRTAADHGPDWQCPSCGVAYSKAAAQSSAVAHKVSSARGSREIDLDELDTVTPGALAFTFDGRIGRLRYLAYSWPLMVMSGLGIAAAIIIPKSPGLAKSRATWMIPIGVLCILWIWTSLRLMALRMHDVNRSSKWVLALLLLPAAGAVTGPNSMPMYAGIFWIVAFLLIIWPGSEGYNNYGPPGGANTLLVKVGAGIVLILMAVGVMGNIQYAKYMRDRKADLAQSTAQDAAGEQPASAQTPREKALLALRQSVQQISPTLPKKIDRVTTLTGVEVNGDTYKVYYSMDPGVQLDASRQGAVEQAAKQQICRGATRNLIDNGISVEYLYTFSGSVGQQTMFVDVPAGSCD